MLNLIHGALLRLNPKDPETAHNLLTNVMRVMNTAPQLLCAIVGRMVPKVAGHPVTFRGVTFPNGVGMAAGFDKQGHLAFFLQLLGFGFVEVGTVTPEEQAGNGRPRIFRILGMLINRMGFNSPGAAVVRRNLARIAHLLNIPIGISLGQMKTTAVAYAVQDYLRGLTLLFEYATYVVINVSSPNTPGLRDLQKDEYLEGLVQQVHDRMRELAKGGFMPLLLVKIDLDMSDADTLATVRAGIDGGADGMIIGNTSLNIKLCEKQEAGGVSGGVLFDRAVAKVALVRSTFPEILIIGVGGIDRGMRVQQMVDAGANLIQLYTSFIYEGPPIVRACVHAMNVAYMRRQRG